MLHCLLEPPRRFLLLLFFITFLIFISFLYLHFIFDLHFVAVLHLSMFFIHICFLTSSLTLPWTIAKFLHPFYTFSPAHHRVIHGTFIFNHSVIFLTRALRFWVGIFYLMLLHRHFNLRLSSPAWETAILLWRLQSFILIDPQI